MIYPTARLDTLCRAVNVGHVGPSSMHRDPNGVPFLMGKNVGFGFVNDHNLERVTEEFHRSQPKSTIRAGDVLVVRIGNSGQAAKVPETLGEANCSGLVIIKQPEGVTADFLVYFLNSPIGRRHSLSQARGATRLTLNTKSIAAARIPVPPLPEQKRIVGILDEAFDAVATAKGGAEENLKNARALFNSYLESVFSQHSDGWVERRLEQIGTTQTGSTPKPSERANYGTYIPFVKPSDFNADGSLDYENDGLTEKGLSKARVVAARSVLMVCIGATIGKCGYSERNIATNQQVNALTPFAGLSHKFVYYQMLTEDFQRRVLLSSGQVTLPIINKSRWSALTLALPPTLDEQDRIATKLEFLSEETRRLESIYKQKAIALEKLKTSLLDQAFSGHL